MHKVSVDVNDPFKIEHHPLLMIISGPSGVGKDTLLQFMKDRGRRFSFVVTMTSRARRSNEVEGRDYFFVNRERFEQLIAQGELLEHSVVYGDYKGIPKSEVRRAFASGNDVIMRIDVQGAAKIKKIVPEAVSVFLMPDSELELIRRLRERKTENEEALQRRFATARLEMQRRMEFDYSVVNYNDRQNEAVDEIVAIITAEHSRSWRGPVEI